MNLCWLTDIHLNFLNADEINTFLDEIEHSHPESILISGDIGESDSICEYLKVFDERFTTPVYFVLGNHDYYGGGFSRTNENVAGLVARSRNLHWLDDCGVVMLDEHTSLIGHTAWADGRFGNYDRSAVMLNDYFLIDDLSAVSKAERLYHMRQFARRAATHLDLLLPDALSRSDHIICLTHIPPFREACWHEGQISDDDWLPHFSCKAVGDVLLKHMSQLSNQRITVLCGHTHSHGFARVGNNIGVYTGRAVYGNPEIQSDPFAAGE